MQDHGTTIGPGPGFCKAQLPEDVSMKQIIEKKIKIP